MADGTGLKDIKEIKKFISDKDAWYHLILPSGYSCDDVMDVKRILDNSRIEGRFLLTTEDMKITDITKYVKECMIEDNKQ